MGLIIENAEKQIDLHHEAVAKERACAIQMRWKIAKGVVDSIIHEAERVIENRRRQTRIDIFRNVRSVFEETPHVEKIYVIGGLATHLLDITDSGESGGTKFPEDWDFMVCEDEWETWDEFQYSFLGPKKFDLMTTDGRGKDELSGASMH